MISCAAASYLAYIGSLPSINSATGVTLYFCWTPGDTVSDPFALNCSSSSGNTDNLDAVYPYDDGGTKRLSLVRKVGGSYIADVGTNGSGGSPNAFSFTAGTPIYLCLIVNDTALQLIAGSAPDNMLVVAQAAASVGGRGEYAGVFFNGWATDSFGQSVAHRFTNIKLHAGVPASLGEVRNEMSKFYSHRTLYAQWPMIHNNDKVDRTGNGRTLVEFGSASSTVLQPTPLDNRIWLPSSGAFSVFTPAFAAGWEDTEDADRIVGKLSKGSTAIATKSHDEAVTTNPVDVLARQFAIGPITTTNPITGSVISPVRALEGAAAANAQPQFVLRVISTGGTVRGTGIDFQTGTGNEYSSTTLTSRLFPRGATAAAPAALTSVTPTVGDYLIPEYGTRDVEGASTNRVLSLSFGENAGADLDLTESDTGADNPYLSISMPLDFIFGQEVTTPTISATAVTAPSTSYAATGPTIVAGNQLYAPTVAHGALALTVSTISATTLSAPTVINTQLVTAPTIAATQLYAPNAVAIISLPTLSGTVLSAPTVINTQLATGPTIASGNQLYAPTIAHAVDLPTLSATVLNAPAVINTQLVTTATISATQLYAPSTAHVVELPIISGTTLAAPTLVQVVALPLISTTQLYAPGAELNVAAPTISGTTLGAPSLLALYALEVSTISGTTLSAPTLAYVVSLPTLNATQLAAPTVVSDTPIDLPTISATSTLYAPNTVAIVNLPSLSGTVLTAPALGSVVSLPTISAAQTFAPAVAAIYTLALPAISATTLATPVVLADQAITLAAIGPTASVFAPNTVAVVQLPAIGAGSLYAPTVAAVYAISLPSLASTVVLGQPVVAYGVDLPAIDVTVLYGPELSGELLAVPTIESGVLLFAPILAQEASIVFLGPTAVLYNPVVVKILLPILPTTVPTVAVLLESAGVAVLQESASVADMQESASVASVRESANVSVLL